MEQNEELESLCKRLQETRFERSRHQARLLLLEIGTFLNFPVDRIVNDRRNWEINRAEAIRDEGWFNETLDMIEELSKLIYYKLKMNYDREADKSVIAGDDYRCLLNASAYINNLVRKAETVGECTANMVKGPKI